MCCYSYPDYIVEKQEEGTRFWEKVPVLSSGETVTVKELEKGKRYKFRVKAENMYGQSEPTETDKSTLAKNPFGRLRLCFNFSDHSEIWHVGSIA